MEFTSESSRYEHGGLGRECLAALAVAAMQRELLLMEDEDEQSTE